MLYSLCTLSDSTGVGGCGVGSLAGGGVGGCGVGSLGASTSAGGGAASSSFLFPFFFFPFFTSFFGAAGVTFFFSFGFPRYNKIQYIRYLGDNCIQNLHLGR